MADGFPDVVPYLYYPDAAAALEFLIRAFGFTERSAVRDDAGRVWTAQVQAGDGVVMIGPGLAQFGTRPVPDPDAATCRIHVLVDDIEAHHARAAREGAIVHEEPKDHFGGMKIYIATDLGGQQWIFAEPLQPPQP